MGLYIQPITRAIDIWRAIQGDPFVIQFRKRDGSTAPAQTVRLAYTRMPTESNSAAGLGVVRTLTIFGVRGHPTVPDTMVEEGYRFIYDGREHRVIDRVLYPGEIRAHAEAVS